MFIIEDQKIVFIKDGKTVGFIDFIFIEPNKVDLIHTFVDPKERGKGIAKELVEYAFDYFQKQNIIVECSCSYAKRIWIQKNSGVRH